MHYEQKEIPSGSGNFYWYRRYVVEGRQKSEYIGKKIPDLEIAEQSVKKIQYQADRQREIDRREIERKIAELSRQLAQLK